MRKRLFTTASFLCLFSTLFCQVYVSNTAGVDAFGGGSLAAPFKTIKFAVQEAPAGSTINIASGNYAETDAIFINKPLILAKNGANPVIIDASARTLANPYMIGIVSTSNVTIDGLTLQNYVGNEAKGIWILGSGSNISVQNCKVSNIGWTSNLATLPPNNSTVTNAIKVEGNLAAPLSNIILNNNEVFNCATGWGEAVTITGNVDGFLVENNKVHDIANIGIVAAGNYAFTNPTPSVNQARNGVILKNEVYNCMSGIANSAGIYLDGSINCTVEKNKCYNNGVGIALGGEQNVPFGASASRGHIVKNNLIYNNCITGIFLGSNNATTKLENTNVFNNTFYKNRVGQTINGVATIGGIAVATIADNFGGEVQLQNLDGVVFKNNIVYPSNNKRAMVALSGYSVNSYFSDFNVYFRDNVADIFALDGNLFNGSTLQNTYATVPGFFVARNLEQNSFFSNPGLSNAAGNDFSLTNTAFSSNKGDFTYDAVLSGTTDFAENPRLFSTRVDAGAFENQNIVLPVAFINPFRATKIKETVKVEWTTASENNNAFFEVQRSINGVDFSTIGTVKGVGNATQITPYFLVDNNPNKGINYYRIKQVDRDEKSVFTNILTVLFDAKKLSIYPNPAHEKLNILTDETIEFVKIKSVNGAILATQKSSFSQINVGNLASGFYILEVKMAGNAVPIFQKIVVEK
jgi:parallel beta-helix repeat protein